MKYLSLVITLLVLAGCARIEVYNKNNEKTGIKFYTPKPYILVSHTGTKDKPTDVSVIYLPDLKNPHYAKLKSGLGSSKLSMGFSNGMMTTVGQEVDPKITELVTALAGVPGQLATADKTREEAVALKRQSANLPAIGAKVETISASITSFNATAKNQNMITTLQEGILTKAASDLDSLGKDMKKPGAGAAANLPRLIANGDKIIAELNKIAVPDLSSTPDSDKNEWRSFDTNRKDFIKIIGSLKPQKVKKTITLYELYYDNSGQPSLREVKPN